MLPPSNPNTSNNTTTTASASTSSRPVYHRPYSKPPSLITSTTLTRPMTPTGAAYQAAYVHSPTVDPIGALRMQRACSLDTERLLYANRQQARTRAAAAAPQAPRQDSACCLKTKKKEEKKWERTVRFVDALPSGKGV